MPGASGFVTRPQLTSTARLSSMSGRRVSASTASDGPFPAGRMSSSTCGHHQRTLSGRAAHRHRRGDCNNLRDRRMLVWGKAVKTVGLQNRPLSPKAIRPTAASMAVAAGAEMKIVQQVLGRVDASMALSTCTSPWPDHLAEKFEAVSAHRLPSQTARNHDLVTTREQKGPARAGRTPLFADLVVHPPGLEPGTH